MSDLSARWSALQAQARAAGLEAWAVPREAIDPQFGAADAVAAPAALHAGYRGAVVLASLGSGFWRGFRHAYPTAQDPAGDPLDRHSEQVVEALRTAWQAVDPTALTVYPFRHPRQVLGFTRLLGRDATWLGPAPFGVWVHPRAGPWWALRGALLTAAALPPAPPAGERPCAPCPAPCVTACPAGAVSKRGIDWRACSDYRLGAEPCRETCLARLACPVGADLRYDADAIAFHGRASLAELVRLRRGNNR